MAVRGAAPRFEVDMEREGDGGRATFAVQRNREVGDRIAGPDTDHIGSAAAVRLDTSEMHPDAIDNDDLADADLYGVSGLTLRKDDGFRSDLGGRTSRRSGQENGQGDVAHVWVTEVVQS